MKHPLVDKCIKDFYVKRLRSLPEISKIEYEVVDKVKTLRKRHGLKGNKDSESLLLIATLNKIGYDKIKKLCSKKL